ncbi:hypothetical protein Tco_1021825 [Tanacetum coccineum]
MRDIVRLKTKRELVRVKIHDGNAFWNEIRVNAGVSKLMLLSLNVLLPVLVNAARLNLLLLVQVNAVEVDFINTSIQIAFLDKPEESEGFEQIIDFLNASSIRYALTVNPTIYTTCIEQFWATAKVKTVNGEHQIQALVDKQKVIPLFQTMMVQAPKDMGEDSSAPTNSHSTPIITQPSSSKPQKKYLQEKVLDLEKAKTTQAKEIASLKKRVKQLEKRKKSKTSGLKRLRKGRKISKLDANAEVTLIDETQERNDEEMLFDVQDDLQGEEVVAEKEVVEKEVSAVDPVTTAGEVVTTANVEVTTASAPTTIDELTLAQTLIKIKAAKPKAVTIAAITTTTTTTRPKARGVVVQEPSK